MVESNLTEISNEVVRTAVHDTAVKHLKTDKVKINVEAASKVGDNFIGVVYRVSSSKFELKGVSDKNKNDSKMIVKVAPQNAARRERFYSRPCFLREIYLYDEVLPFFHKFQESMGVIVEENGFREYPKCYKTIDTDPNECLMLEDMKASNFLMLDRRNEKITDEHVRLVMQALGKYHAISYALKDQQPEKFNSIVSNVDEIFVRRGDKLMGEYIEFMAKNVTDSVADGEYANERDKLAKLYVRSSTDISADCVDGNNEPYAILCHGDCWTNNTMFKYNQSGKVIDVCLLDFQIARFASPVCDLVYYIFCCTEKELRDKCYDGWLKTYHESLTNLLNKLGSDAEKIFPYDALLQQMRKHGKFGMTMASMLLPMLTAEEGHAVDLDALSEDMNSGKEIDKNAFISENSRDILMKRMRDVVIDMVRLEYV